MASGQSYLQSDFVENASVESIRAQYERAQAQADLWSDRARELFLLLCRREEDGAGQGAPPVDATRGR